MTQQTFKFPSRSSDAEHTVTVGANNHMHCTCNGFKSPSKCWHVREVSERLNIPHTVWSSTPALPGIQVISKEEPDDPFVNYSKEIQAARESFKFIEPMLGKALKEGDSIDNYVGDPRWSMELKYDGHRIILHVDANHVSTAYSRDNNQRELSRHIVNHLQYLAPGVYDGELYIPGKSSTHVTRKDMLHKHKLVLFDILSVYAPEDVGRIDAQGYRSTLHLPLSARRSLLTMAMSKVPNVEVFQATWVRVQPDYLQEIWKAGGEGVMLKRDDESYQPGRRVWPKFKKELTERMTVTGFKAGKLGPHSRVCGEDKHGVKVQCKTLDTRMRAAFDADPDAFIGRTLVFNYQQKTDDGRYRSPRCDHFEE